MSIATSEPIITAGSLSFSYNLQPQHPIHALKGIELEVHRGEYLVIIGHNGSGKSTLAKHFNALLRPTGGEVRVKGLDTRDRGNTLAVRRTVGMIFQVPDNQIVATVVEEDVAFGPENLGVPNGELRARVAGALELVGMAEYRHRRPHDRQRRHPQPALSLRLRLSRAANGTWRLASSRGSHRSAKTVRDGRSPWVGTLSWHRACRVGDRCACSHYTIIESRSQLPFFPERRENAARRAALLV